jgi:hypothetical protein
MTDRPRLHIRSLLASRERFCLHADVSRAADKASACADATVLGKSSCSHLDKVRAACAQEGTT